jgi:hypothetical protein
VNLGSGADAPDAAKKASRTSPAHIGGVAPPMAGAGAG